MFFKDFIKKEGLEEAFNFAIKRIGFQRALEFILSIKEKKPTVVQSLLFDRKTFSKDQAEKWATDYLFGKSSEYGNMADFCEIRQSNPDAFNKDSLKTIEIDSGVKASIGHLNGKDYEMDEKQAKELIDGMKSLVELHKQSLENQKNILTQLGTKPKDDEEDKDDSKKAIEDRLKALEDNYKKVDDCLEKLSKMIETLAGNEGE
jgi:hypothetical protein